LTIENKGEIPADLRPQMGNWVFGCDVCQQVCPWNLRFAGAPPDAALASRPQVPTPNLAEEIGLTPLEFNRKFNGSPIQRPHRRGYLRNVAVALGNLADPALIPPLARALEEDAEALVRGHAAWALGRTSTRLAHEALDRALKREPDETVRAEIRSALG
jgi:epoxyqueuosine reductase